MCACVHILFCNVYNKCNKVGASLMIFHRKKSILKSCDYALLSERGRHVVITLALPRVCPLLTCVKMKDI